MELLAGQARTRVPELVPLRYGHMLVSLFTFYRGAAVTMASDLANTPRSGIAAERNLCDYEMLVEAVQSSRVEAQTGL